MPVSVSQFIVSAEHGGEALRLIRAALNLTQADLVARADGAIGTDQISLIERGKRPMTSKQCTTIARALHLTDEDEAQLILLAQIDRVPERLKPILRQVRRRSRLHIVEAFLLAYPPEKMEAFLTTLDALAEVWPHLKATGLSSQNALPPGPTLRATSPEGTHDGV
jgi:transcriptional regulator with XRE-family HTH domain